MPRLQTLKSTVRTLGSGPTQVLNPSSWRTSNQSAAARGYDHEWRKRREQQLRNEPLCRYCLQDGKTTAATVADHIVPHRGDKALFKGPLQSLCATCHSGRKAKEEQAAGLR